MSAARRTAIRAGWIIAFDGRGSHLDARAPRRLAARPLLHRGPREPLVLVLGALRVPAGSGRGNTEVGRDDLGRIAPGARADLVLWKATSWRMTPLRDPVKNIVYNATDEDVDRVYLNGRLVVAGGRVLAADEAKILRDLQVGGERMWPRMSKFDWAGRGADVLLPQTYPEWDR